MQQCQLTLIVQSVKRQIGTNYQLCFGTMGTSAISRFPGTCPLRGSSACWACKTSDNWVLMCAQGVGERIAARSAPKIFLLNGSHDRETSASERRAGTMSAADVVSAVCDALNRRHTKARLPPENIR